MNDKYIQVCHCIYEREYRNLSPFIGFPLPIELNRRIHQFRPLDDLKVKLSDIKTLLGFGQTIMKDHRLDCIFNIYVYSPVLYDDQTMRINIVLRPHFLQYATEEIKTDKKFNLAIVCKNGNTLRFCSREFKNDKDIVLAAVRNHGSFFYADKNLRQDKTIVLAAVSICGHALEAATADS